MPEDVQTLRSVGFRLLYETGRPVTMETLAERSGFTVAKVEETLSKPELVGRSRRNTMGHLIGIAGLSVEPTPHEIRIGGARFWTWCALDAVGIFRALGETGVVYSTRPDDSETLEIQFIDGESQSNLRLFILGEFDETTSYEDWCPNVNFFANSNDATLWARTHQLDGDVVTISEIADDAGEIWRPVVADVGATSG